MIGETAGPLAMPPLPLTPGGGWARRILRLGRDALRLEDLVLIIWVALGPVIFAVVRGTPPTGTTVSDPFSARDPLTGLLELGAAAAALLCLATRPAADPPLDPDGTPAAVPSQAPQSLIERGVVGPLTGGFLLVTAAGSQALFGEGDTGFGLAIGGVVVAVVLRTVLPPVPAAWRRALVMPYVLVSSSLLGAVLGQVDGLFDLRAALEAGLAAAVGAVLPVLAIIVAFCAVFYLMLVYAPRQVTQADGGAITWLVRFTVFVVAEIVATTLIGPLTPS